MDCTVYRKKQQHAEGNGDDGEEWEEFDELYVDPVDSNDIQNFPAELDSDSIETREPCTSLRIEFERSTDFYGRIVIYSFEVWGAEVNK